MTRMPVPPFSFEDAVKKVRMAEDAWNTRDPDKVALAYTPNTKWGNREAVGKVRKGLNVGFADEADFWCHFSVAVFSCGKIVAHGGRLPGSV